MSIDLQETAGVMTWPNGGHNESADIAITKEGVEIMDGHIILPWEWIDKARKKIAPLAMTKEDAWRIIEECRGWNVGQKSWQCAKDGERTQEDEVHEARRAALHEAWKTVGMGPN